MRTSLALLSLAALATAEDGYSIPLVRRTHPSKRSLPANLTDSLQRPLERVVAKYQRNLAILAEQVGHDELYQRAGAKVAQHAVTKPRSKFAPPPPHHVDKRYSPGHRMMHHYNPALSESKAAHHHKNKKKHHHSTKKHPRSSKTSQTNVENLVNYDTDVSWLGYASYGTPAQSLLMLFDTGSADVWTMSTSCGSSQCAAHTRYSASDSSTFSTLLPSTDAFFIGYGDGSNATGPVGSDVVSVAGVGANSQGFSPVDQIGGLIGSEEESGIIGMAFPQLSRIYSSAKSLPFFHTLYSQHAVSSPRFSFRLAPSTSSDQSSLYLGGLDPTLYQAGTTEWHGVVNPWFWNITATPLVKGHGTKARSIGAIIDTGTTLIVAPLASAQAFYKNVPGAVYYGSGYWVIPCDKFPTVEFKFSKAGRKWVVNYNIGVWAYGYCYSGIVGQDVGLGSTTWILGDVFLKSVYATFDIKKRQVGFSQLS